MSSNWDEANTVHVTGKKAKKKRYRRPNLPDQKKLVFNPFAVTYRTASDDVDMYTGSNLFSSVQKDRSQLPVTETIDLSAEMDCDSNHRPITPTHGKSKPVSAILIHHRNSIQIK